MHYLLSINLWIIAVYKSKQEREKGQGKEKEEDILRSKLQTVHEENV